MKSLLLGVALICILQAQEQDTEIQKIKQTSNSKMDCLEAGGTLVYNNVRYGCNDDTSEIKIENYGVMCQKDDTDEWYSARECKSIEKPDYCNTWETDQRTFYWSDWQFGCPRSTSQIEVYKSREQNVIALCDNETLASVCRQGWWADSSNLLQFVTSTLLLLLGLALI